VGWRCWLEGVLRKNVGGGVAIFLDAEIKLEASLARVVFELEPSFRRQVLI